jgi:hypothetical protein
MENDRASHGFIALFGKVNSESVREVALGKQSSIGIDRAYVRHLQSATPNAVASTRRLSVSKTGISQFATDIWIFFNILKSDL